MIQPTLIRKTFATMIALAGCAALPLIADAQKPPMRVQVSVGDVTDNRTTGSFFAECKVELKFTGDAVADAGSVRKVTVAEATDDTGRNLKPEEEDSSSSFFNSSHSSGTLKTEVKLKNPSRNASTIKTLKGQAEFFSPTEANGAIVIIPDALKHPAEPINHPTLKKYGIELIYLTKESYEAKKKELAAKGDSGNIFGNLFQGMFGGMSDSKNTVQLYVKDPQKMIVDWELQDATGKPLKTESRMTSNEFSQTDLQAPAPADTRLRLHLAVPDAVKVCPFEVHDIPLP